MTNPSELLLAGRAFSAGHQAPILDPSQGGQFGYANNYKEYLSNSGYIRTNLIPIVLTFPTFFDYMPNPDVWKRMCKAIFETRPKSIEGLNGGLTVEYGEHEFGAAGEMQSEVINVTRARTEPVFNYASDIYGNAIQTFIYYWISYGLMDADTKYPLVGTLDNHPDMALHDLSSMTMAFIEPDTLHRKVQKSWIVTGMRPKGTGDIIGRMDKVAGSELTEFAIETTGVAQFNLGTNVVAQKLLDDMNITNASPLLRPAFITERTADAKAATNGYAEGVASMASGS